MPDVEVDLTDLCADCLEGHCDKHTADQKRKAQRTAARRRRKAAKEAEAGNGNGKHAPATSRRSPKAKANGHK